MSNFSAGRACHKPGGSNVVPSDPLADQLSAIVKDGALLKYCRQLAGNYPDADDLFQETLTRALERADRFVDRPGASPDDDPLRAWLYRIARNTWIDTARRRQHRPDHPTYDGELPDDTATPHSADRASDTDTPDLIAAALEALPPKDREIIRAVTIGEQTYAELSRQTGIEQPALRQRVSRAKRALAQTGEALLAATGYRAVAIEPPYPEFTRKPMALPQEE